jgi:hypothetical protein
MDNATDPSDADERAPMTIKAVPIKTRETIIRLSRLRKQTVAVWLANAVEQMAETQAGDGIAFPKTSQTLPVIPSGQPQQNRATIPITDLRDAMVAAVAIAGASGLPVPKTAARHALALLTAQLRHARGLPDVQQRQLRKPIGQTIDA